jgi:hypothetical protein
MAESTRDGQLVGVLYRRLLRNLLQSILPGFFSSPAVPHTHSGAISPHCGAGMESRTLSIR